MDDRTRAGRWRTLAAVMVAGAVVSACQSWKDAPEQYPERTGSELMNPTPGPDEGKGIITELKDTVDALNPFADKKKEEARAGTTDAAVGGGGAGIGVNSWLWRASLDTVSFMPLASADPFGGVIITDWHSPDGTERERFKMNVYILVRSLRADGVRVSVFRQVVDRTGNWQDAAVPVQTASRIEDAILTRARQLRSESLRQ